MKSVFFSSVTALWADREGGRGRRRRNRRRKKKQLEEGRGLLPDKSVRGQERRG